MLPLLYPTSPAPQTLHVSSLTVFPSFISLPLSESSSKLAAERGPSFQKACAYTSNGFWELPKSLPSERGSEGRAPYCFVSKHESFSSKKLQELQRLWMPGLLDSILQSAQPWTEACPSWAGPHHPHQWFLVISEALVPLKCVVQHKQACLHDQSLPCTFS